MNQFLCCKFAFQLLDYRNVQVPDMLHLKNYNCLQKVQAQKLYSKLKIFFLYLSSLYIPNLLLNLLNMYKNNTKNHFSLSIKAYKTLRKLNNHNKNIFQLKSVRIENEIRRTRDSNPGCRITHITP